MPKNIIKREGLEVIEDDNRVLKTVRNTNKNESNIENELKDQKGLNLLNGITNTPNRDILMNNNYIRIKSDNVFKTYNKNLYSEVNSNGEGTGKIFETSEKEFLNRIYLSFFQLNGDIGDKNVSVLRRKDGKLKTTIFDSKIDKSLLDKSKKPNEHLILINFFNQFNDFWECFSKSDNIKKLSNFYEKYEYKNTFEHRLIGLIIQFLNEKIFNRLWI